MHCTLLRAQILFRTILLGWIFRLMRRRKPLSADAHNVVVSIGKAEALYKELVKKAHPDRNIDNRKEAEKITHQLNRYRRDYRMLVQLKKRIENEL